MHCGVNHALNWLNLYMAFSKPSIFQKGTLLEDPREGRRMYFQKEEFIFKKGAL